MENKNENNRFAGSSLGGKSKYIERHQNAVRIERAGEIDKRIAAFDAQKHDLDWARRAVDFCDRELENGRDVADISKGIKDLPRIKQEALDIIAAEDRRLKEEQDALKLQQKQLELKTKADEDAAVSNAEKLITSVSEMSRTREWIDEVEKLNLMLKGFPSKLFDRVSNRYLVEVFNKEAKDVGAALDLDDEIIELDATRMKNKSWAEKVFKIEKKLSAKLDKYMKEKSTFFKLSGLASKIYYSEDVSLVENFIKKVEEEHIEQALEDYNKASKTVEKLRDAIYIEEYISNFESRWVTAKDRVEETIKENKKIEAERIKAQKAQQKLDEEIAIKNAQKAAKAKARRKVFGKILVVLLHIAVIAGVIGFGALNITTPVGAWVLSGGCSAIVCYFWIFFGASFFDKKEILRNLLFGVLLALPVVGLNIASMFVESFGFYFLPPLAAIVIISIFNVINFGDDEDLHCGGIVLDAALITLGFVLYVSIGGILGALLCAASLIVMGICHAVLVHVLDWQETYMYTLAILLFIASAVPIWWGRWDTLILSLGLAIGGTIVGFGNTEADEFSPGTITALIMYGIVFVIGLAGIFIS